MTGYVVRWVPTGPEVAVGVRSLDEAMAMAEELQAIGRCGQVRVERIDEVTTLFPAPAPRAAPRLLTPCDAVEGAPI